MTRAPEPVFEAPWHAQVFALTVHLNESGHFSWSDWAARFGATLARQGLNRTLGGGDDYFAAWLETLEAYLAETGAAPSDAVEKTRSAWERAFRQTAHGAQVSLDR